MVFRQKTMPQTAIKKHKEMIDYYFAHPWLIENGFKPVFKEFGTSMIKRGGRMDLFGVDKDGNLCAVEFKTGANIDQRQLSKYRAFLRRLVKALAIKRGVRVIVITPKGSQDHGLSSPDVWESQRANPVSSKEVFGLK